MNFGCFKQTNEKIMKTLFRILIISLISSQVLGQGPNRQSNHENDVYVYKYASPSSAKVMGVLSFTTGSVDLNLEALVAALGRMREAADQLVRTAELPLPQAAQL